MLTIRYIVPEQVPVQYGGLSREGEQEFTIADSATEDTVKPASKHTVEFPVTEVYILTSSMLKRICRSIYKRFTL